MIKAYAPQYENFAEPEGYAFGAYGDRIANSGDDQIIAALGKLAEDSETRQCVISMWRTQDMTADVRDRPCTLTLQFMIRDGFLHLIVNMRSNDAWLGFPYDVFCFTMFQAMMAASLNVDLGVYIHQAASMHLYEKHFEAAEEAGAIYTHAYDHHWPDVDDMSCVSRATWVEERMRRGGEMGLGDPNMSALHTCMKDITACTGRKWGYNLPILSQAFNAYFRRNGSDRQDDVSEQANGETA